MRVLLPFLTLLMATQLNASGFATARFGGEHGHPTTNNATAVYYNPAMLPFSGKTRLMIDGTLAFRDVTYFRPSSAITCLEPNCSSGTYTPLEAASANSGTAHLNNQALAPFIGASTTIGKKLGLGFAISFPFGGAASWSENEEYAKGEKASKYVGAKDGVQRWWAIDSSLKVMFLSFAAGYKLADWISVGLTVSAVKSEIETVRARNSDGISDSLVRSGGPVERGNFEGRSFVKASSWDVALNAGIAITPKKGLFIGYNFQSKPGLAGATNPMEGTVSLYNAVEGKSDVQNIYFRQTLPMLHRFGVRWRPNGLKKFEFRLFGDYVHWSEFKSQKIEGKKEGNDILTITRNWQNAFGVRTGMSYWLKDNIETYVGLGFDGNAVPDQYMDPSLFDMNKYTMSLGSKFSLYRKFVGNDVANSLWMSITYTQIFYETRNITNLARNEMMDYVNPPAAIGKYSQSIGVANLNLEYRF
jgi:long-chain fatty acid transport protein